MTGKTIVITGASDGIGAAAARQLSRRGETVVIVGRSLEKTTAIADELDADRYIVDFGDLSAVRRLGEDLGRRYNRIDVLANNAGGMANTITYTADGHEKLLQVNFLAPFLLTSALLELLAESKASVISTSSASQKIVGRPCVDDLLNTQRFSPSKAYGLTKLAIILFVRELHRRYHGEGISTAAFHPGWVHSNIGPASGNRLLAFVHKMPFGHFGKSTDDGAQQLVWLASASAESEWTSGEYYSGGRVVKANRTAYDVQLGEELWTRTAELVSS